MLRVITLRFDDRTGTFDNALLKTFAEDENCPREILDVFDQFFVHDRRPT